LPLCPAAGRANRQALKLRVGARVVGRFLDGDNGLKSDELKAIASFTGEFGRAMETDRLIRRPRS
jgi:hypothetical protein